MTNLTKALVARAFSITSYKNFSDVTKENIKKGLLDYLVCCHAAVQYDSNFENVWNARTFRGEAEDDAVVFGTGEKVHPFDACLINGYASHALDLDDVHSVIRGHPSAVILSLLFSLTNETRDANRFYEAYVIGIEVMARFSQLLGKSHYEKGFHTTATAGLYGAVSAGAYYLNYSEKEATSALDLSVSQFSGSRSHFGTLVKPLHAGLTAQKAWQLLHFVKQGVVGNSDTIRGSNGLLAMYGGNSSPEKLLINWREPWNINNPGLWFKLYPCCSANAHPIDATLQLLENHEIDSNQIRSVRLYFPEYGDAALVYTSPVNGEEGRFSPEYCVASLLLGKELSIENFSVPTIETEVVQLMNKMERVYDNRIPFAEESYPSNRYSIVEIEMDNGVIYKERCDIPKGSPGDPLQLADLKEKAKNILKEQADPILRLFSGEETNLIARVLLEEINTK